MREDWMLETTDAEDAERHAVDEMLYVAMATIRARATREDQTFDLLEPVDVNARDPAWIARRACCDPRHPGVGPHDHLYTQDSRDQEAVLDRVIAAQDRARNAERERRRLYGPNGHHPDDAGGSNGGYPFSDYCAW
ncbi:Chromatin structure-remodeling complex subunit rsc7 [Verticillium dahliae VDG1]|nr:Chromatin structure-remodeling complex subunit rsc7 [Verticillium dahliae VDG1]